MFTSATDAWDRRIRRAEQLAADNQPASPLLTFYTTLLRQQKRVYDAFDRLQPTGSLDADVTMIAACGNELLEAIAASGPAQLGRQGRELLEGDPRVREQALLEYWQDRSDRRFFPKALIQPYAQWCADRLPRRADRPYEFRNRCPSCGGAPQLSVLEPPGAVLTEGGTRRLICATCLTPWPFRRVLCPSCGEEEERKLGYFQTPSIPHVRVDACESCGRYLKAVDLGQLGAAVPLVDEVGAATLDVWAREHGYEKIELNLVGL
jgi:formate dehydrogenase maturation protein FdhE